MKSEKKKSGARIEAEKKAVRGDMTREVEALFTDGLLINLNIGQWAGLAKNTKEDLGITHNDPLPKYVVGLGMKRMCPHALAKTWGYHASRARTVLYAHAFTNFPLSGGAFVPAKALPTIIDLLEQHKEKFDKAWRAGLIDNFDQVREDFLSSQKPEHRERLEQIFPTRAVVEERFYFEYSAYTVSLPKKIQGLKDKASEDAMEKFRRDLDTRVEGFLAESVQTLRAKAADLCTTVIDNVKSGKTVSQKNLKSLASFIDRFKALNFVGDTQIEAKLTALRQNILDGVDPEMLTAKGDEAARARLAAALEEIREAAQDVTDISAVTGQYRRKIVID